MRKAWGGAVLCALGAMGAMAQETQPPSPHPPLRPRRRSGPRDCPKKGTWTFNLDIGLGGLRFRELPLHQRPARPLGRPERQLGRELREACGFSGLRSRAERALRQGQRRRRAHLRGAAHPRRRVGFLLPRRRPVPGLALGPSLGSSENLLDFTVGRTPYQIGHGYLALGRGRRRGQPRRLLEQRAQGLGVRGGRAPEARPPHLRGLLSRPRRGPGERDRDAALGRELRAGSGRDLDLRGHLPEVPRGPGGGARPRRIERVQPAGVHQPLQGPARPLLRAGVRAGGERRSARAPTPSRPLRPTS